MRTHTINKVYAWPMRVLSAVLVLLLASSLLLYNMSQIRIRNMAYADSEHAMATNALLDSTQYLHESDPARMFSFLKAFFTPAQTFSRCYTLASAAIGRLDYGEALAYIDYCIALGGDVTEALLADLWLKKGCLHSLLGDQDTALVSLDLALDTDSYIAMDAYYVKMQLLVAKGNTEEAIENLNTYLSLVQNGELYSVLGDLYTAQADYQQALDAYDSAIAMDETDGHAQFMRGICRMQLGDLASADSDFSAALSLDMQPAMSHYYRGVMRLSQSRYAEAEADFTEAMATAGDETAIMELWYNRGVSRMAQGNFAAAAEDFLVSVEQGEAIGDSLFQCGVSLLEIGDPQGADTCFTAYLAQGGSTEQAIYYQAMARMQTGQYDEAARDFSRCISDGLFPLDSRFYRAQCYMAQEAYRLAISDLTSCLDEGIFEETALYYRGLCYLALGDTEKGEADLALAVGEPPPLLGGI